MPVIVVVLEPLRSGRIVDAGEHVSRLAWVRRPIIRSIWGAGATIVDRLERHGPGRGGTESFAEVGERRCKRKAQGAIMKKDYEVGFGKPPLATQFKKGKSGNPRGRPKKKLHGHRSNRPHMKDDFLRVIQRRMTIAEESGTRRITLQRALIKGLVDRAIQGHVASIARLWTLFKHYHLDREPDPNITFHRWTPAVEKLIENFLNEETPTSGTATSFEEEEKRYRPKRDHIMDDLLLELQQPITISEGGRSKKITKQEALLRILARQCLKGNTKAWDLVWAMSKHYELDQEPDKYLRSFRERSPAELQQAIEKGWVKVGPDGLPC